MANNLSVKLPPDGGDVSMKKRSQSKDILRRFLKNKVAVLGFLIILLLLFCSLFPGALATHGYDELDFAKRFTPPGTEFILGADEFGRDIYSRIVYGCRTSLSIGVSAVAMGCVIGTLLGCVAGYYNAVTDNILMRFVDILMSIPNLMLAMSIVAALGISQFNLTLAIGISTIGGFARITRGQILSVKEQEFIEVARAIGASDARIILRHLLPNSLAPIIVQISTGIGSAILSAAGMSFLGLGVPPPTPEWGAMLTSGREFMRDHWFVVVFPGLAIMIAVFAFNLFGDGLRDALDPRLKS